MTPLPDPNYPKGCLIFKHRDHIEVYFNTHKNGSRQSSSRQLCIRSGKLSKSVFGTTLSVIILSITNPSNEFIKKTAFLGGTNSNAEPSTEPVTSTAHESSSTTEATSKGKLI